MIQKNRFYGTLYGQAIGDALGLGTEFMSTDDIKKYYPNALKEYHQIIQDEHRARWNHGEWTDDTDMMMCILDALIDCKGNVDLIKIAENFKSWFNGNPLGIGNHTFKVLCMEDYTLNPIYSAEIIWTLYKKRSVANGGVMRTSVVGLLKENVEDQAKDICRLTHPDTRCIGSAVIVSLIIHELVYHSREMSYDEIIAIGEKYDERIAEYIHLAFNATNTQELELEGLEQGYTLKNLGAALWTYWHSRSFEQGLLDIVNAGGDADTNAAVACAILGAKFGVENIPSKYIEGLYQKELLEDKVMRLYDIYK